MSFIPKNPLSFPKISYTPSTPPGTKGIFAKEDGFYEVDEFGNESKIGGDGNGLSPTVDKGAGDNSITIGEGCDATGECSVASGKGTTAAGQGSHTEGLGTQANGDYQHVQGKWNVRDNEQKYAHIIGNGTSNTNRVNIHTVDWNGNAWYKGNVTVGDNKEELATQTYVNSKIASMVDSAPETLDTLNELSQALGDDPNFATTVATEIGKKADKTYVDEQISGFTSELNAALQEIITIQEDLMTPNGDGVKY